MKLIKNGIVHTVTGGVLENHDILVNNGKIVKIAKDITENAETIDAKGLNIFPGLIDGHSHLGMMEDSIGFEGDDLNEVFDPVTPYLRGIDGINPMDVTFKEAYEQGVTTVATGPGSANVIGGQYACIKTYGNRVDNMIVKEYAALKCAFGENPKVFYNRLGKSPKTRMATAAYIRRALFEAVKYEKKIAGNPDCDRDFNLEPLVPVIRGEIPLKAHAHRVDDIFTAIRIAKEFNVKITLDHCSQGHLIVDELAKEKLPVFLGPSIISRSKFELKTRSIATAAILTNAGIDIAIITDAPVIPQGQLRICVAHAINAGLSFEHALRSVTINPAKFLGISDRVGSIDVGKDADLIICDSHPFKIESKIILTMINGDIVYSI